MIHYLITTQKAPLHSSCICPASQTTGSKNPGSSLQHLQGSAGNQTFICLLPNSLGNLEIVMNSGKGQFCHLVIIQSLLLTTEGADSGVKRQNEIALPQDLTITYISGWKNNWREFVEIERAAELSGAAQSPFASNGHPGTEIGVQPWQNEGDKSKRFRAQSSAATGWIYHA